MEQKRNKYLMLCSVLFLIIAYLINFFASQYVTHVADTTIVGDLILDHIPRVDLSFLFVYFCGFILLFYIFYPIFNTKEDFSYAIFQLAVLIVVRAIFISFTHLGDPQGVVYSTSPIFTEYLLFKNDLFFSGHVAFTFLGYWVFKNRDIKYLFLFSSILMAFTVLFMGLHYSIDVFAAFFITYSVFKISDKIYPVFSNLFINRG